MYKFDNRIVLTLDAGGTNLVFSAMRGYENIVEPVTLPSNAKDLDLCLQTMVDGFTRIMEQLEEKPVAISFAFPGPADYEAGIIGGFLPNFPSFRDGVALGPFLRQKFDLPVYINNDGDLYAFGEAIGGILPEINDKLEKLGSAKRYKNLLGFTFGTGLGIGEVINGQLNIGNNSCVETFCLRNKRMPDVIAEEGAAIRAIIREYVNLVPDAPADLTPFDIFKIAEGDKEGDKEAARKAFAMFGEVAGDAIATAVTLTDSLVVIGGGITGAAKYIMPSLLDEMRSSLRTLGGEEVQRVQMRVFDLDNELEFAKFAMGDSRELKVYGSNDTVIYDPMKRTGVAITRVGASKAIMIGAYSYALSKIDSK